MYYKAKYLVTTTALKGPTVLIFSNESEIASLYGMHLTDRFFTVVFCEDVSKLVSTIHEQNPAVVLLHLSDNVDSLLRKLSSFRRTYPDLPIVTVGLSLSEESMKAVMRLRGAGHINREYSKPKDIVVLLEQIISQNNK